ncbi:hypothetical protein Mapa_015004 [Marchantia paleacea]|nr:hypothetical protein Mapa_015004 [Marchantia paleacea]
MTGTTQVLSQVYFFSTGNSQNLMCLHTSFSIHPHEVRSPWNMQHHETHRLRNARIAI